MISGYLLLFMGTAIVVTFVWMFWTALTRSRIYLGRSKQRWLYRADDPRRFRINLVFGLFVLAGGVWMARLGLRVLGVL